MISFFRKLRQKLLEQNRVTRYLFYALGEILLVVIGILIALAINNWNEERKANEAERELLIFALENIQTDSLSLDSIISRTDKILEVQKQLIQLSENDISKDEVGNLDLIRASEPNLLILEKNNPNLPYQVKDPELRKALLDYYLIIERFEFTVLNHNEVIEEIVRPFLGDKKLLNYGTQLESDLLSLDLVNDERFFDEFQNEELRQILFESGIKLRIMRNNAKRTALKNESLKEIITAYLKDK